MIQKCFPVCLLHVLFLTEQFHARTITLYHLLIDLLKHLIGWQKHHIISGMYVKQLPDIFSHALILLYRPSGIFRRYIHTNHDLSFLRIKRRRNIDSLIGHRIGQHLHVIFYRQDRCRKENSRYTLIQAKLQIIRRMDAI